VKIFIWADPYRVSYGSSLLIAVAETLEDAKLQAISGKSYCYGLYDQFQGPHDSLVAQLGDPTRIIEAPSAEWHQWSE
jgi:hypothetical protein